MTMDKLVRYTPEASAKRQAEPKTERDKSYEMAAEMYRLMVKRAMKGRDD